MSFKPKRIEEPQEPEEPVRPSSADLTATISPLASRRIPTGPSPRLIARVFKKAGYDMPEIDLKGGTRQRRTYD
jgi:hypothetical protein